VKERAKRGGAGIWALSEPKKKDEWQGKKKGSKNAGEKNREYARG